MIIVRLQGGLGNQLFQYAAGRALAERHGVPLYLDHRVLEERLPLPGRVFREFDLDLLGVSPRRVPPKYLLPGWLQWPGLRKVLPPVWPGSGIRYWREPHFHYDDRLPSLGPKLYLDGYWQSPKYFAGIEPLLRSELRFTDPVLPGSRALLASIESAESVCVNVRRTDFVGHSHHINCSVDYYHRAMDLLRDRLGQPRFFLFGDDKPWMETQFGGISDAELVGEAHDGPRFANKLQLMSRCRHFIIPNSSYAWWAVWLANRPQTEVIAPSRWFHDPRVRVHDLLPDSWTLLEPFAEVKVEV